MQTLTSIMFYYLHVPLANGKLKAQSPMYQPPGHAIRDCQITIPTPNPVLSPLEVGTRGAHILATCALSLFGILPRILFLFSWL